jgi:hypothetical protein
VAITLAGSYFAPSASNAQTQTLTTASFTPATGDVMILKGVTENENVALQTPSATGGGITWTKRLENTSVSTTYAVIWSGVVTSGGSAITVSIGSIANAQAAGGWCSMLVERWSGAQLATTPTTSMLGAMSSAPYTDATTTTAANSIVSFVDGDWNAIAPGTPTYYSASTVQESIHDKSTGSYVAYYAYQTTTTAGVQTYGVTSPTGRKSMLLSIEVQDSGGSPPPTYRGLMLTGIGT